MLIIVAIRKLQIDLSRWDRESETNGLKIVSMKRKRWLSRKDKVVNIRRWGEKLERVASIEYLGLIIYSDGELRRRSLPEQWRNNLFVFEGSFENERDRLLVIRIRFGYTDTSTG